MQDNFRRSLSLTPRERNGEEVGDLSSILFAFKGEEPVTEFGGRDEGKTSCLL